MFEAWDSGAFERPFWESLMHGVWVTLALAAAAALVVELWLPNWGARVPRRVVRRTCITFTVLGFFAYFSFFNPNVRYDKFYNRGDFYHHYLGAKFFDELGYTRLYECTAVAEVELGKGAQLRDKEMRDLEQSDVLVGIAKTQVFDAPGHCKDHFSAGRWEEFRTDVSWFQTAAAGPYWDSLKKERGYDRSPAWTFLAKRFTSWAPASDTSLKWLASIDVLLHVATLAVTVWGFGWRAAAVASVFWASNAASGFTWTGGGFLQQDWVFLLMASMACARRKRPALAGAAIAAAALLKVFPAILAVGYCFMLAAGWLRRRAFDAQARQFLAGLGLTLALLVPAGWLQGSGNGYGAYSDYLSLHGSSALTNDMGLPVVFAHDWSERLQFAKDPNFEGNYEEWKLAREERIAERAQWPAIAALICALWVWWTAAHLRSLWVAIPLSLPLLCAALQLPCYGYLAFLTLAPLVCLRRSLGVVTLALGALSQVLLERVYWLDDRYVALSLLFMAAALLGGGALARKFSWHGFAATFNRASARPKTPVTSR